jgi:hypothetical protein
VSPEVDPYDSFLKVTVGQPDVPVNIDGSGGLRLSSPGAPVSSVRMWVMKTWLNTEQTIYIKRTDVCENIGLRSRSKHPQDDTPNCLFGNYIANWDCRTTGLSQIEVEVTHPCYDRDLTDKLFGKTIPTDKYVGFKQITRTFGNKVLVKGYSNFTATENLSVGGQSHSDWVKDNEYVFDGTNATAASDPITPDVFTQCGTTGDNLLGDLTANTLWLNSGNACWFRINNATGYRLRWASVREVNPIL